MENKTVNHVNFDKLADLIKIKGKNIVKWSSLHV